MTVLSTNDFNCNLTNQLIETTINWHQESDFGSFKARVVNYLFSTLTHIIDMLAHLTFATIAFVKYIFEKDRPMRLSKNFEDHVDHLICAGQHALGSFTTPYVGLFRPDLLEREIIHFRKVEPEIVTAPEVMPSIMPCPTAQKYKVHPFLKFSDFVLENCISL